MEIITTVKGMQERTEELRRTGSTIGCVPTMGFLHEGHASLVRASASRHDRTVTSIFVNPTQFGPNEDFGRYPRDFERDVATVGTAGGSIIFAPTVEEMYPDGYATSIHITGVTDPLEGGFRPGHFDGVATVVAKLLIAIQPHEALFGAKDYQQTCVVKRLVRDLGLPVTITVEPTIREADGLAMSSRNIYLSTQDRQKATVLFRALMAGISEAERGVASSDDIERTMRDVLSEVADLSVDYASAVLADSLQRPSAFGQGVDIVLLIAARLGSTRLIDNMTCRIGG